MEISMTAARFLFALGAGPLALALFVAPLAFADAPVKVILTLKNHKFSPAEPKAPAGKPIVVEIVNQDQTPAEFESKPLRVEKVVVGGSTITVNLRPLKPGRYRFFDDYHEATEGFLEVQ
jgi:Cupredoxin-like domain